MKILIKTLIISILTVSFSNAENKWSFYTGMFDFSDDGKRANLFGAEYIYFNASKDIFFGNVQPVTGVTKNKLYEREDIAYKNTVEQEKILLNAPEKVGKYFTVPKVIE